MSEQEVDQTANNTLDFDACKSHMKASFDSIAFNQNLGLTLDLIEADEVRASFQMQPHLIGNSFHHILHGGVTASVMDSTGGAMASAAVMSRIKHIVPEDLEAFFNGISKMGTVGLHIDYLQPGRGESFVVTAKVLRAGSKVVAVRVELHNDSDELIAVAGGNYVYTGIK